jgi:hypothetical protein
VDKFPQAILQQGFEVIIGIAAFVSRCSVPDFEVQDIL